MTYSPKETVEGDHQYHEIEQLLVLQIWVQNLEQQESVGSTTLLKHDSHVVKVILDVLVEAKDVPWRIDITMSKLRSL